MAKVACPECKKGYDVPQQALGRTATCKCGKKFRLGNKSAVATAAKPPSAAKPSDSFWEEALAEPSSATGLDSIAPDFETEVARPLTVAKRSATPSATFAGWKPMADAAFRLAALVVPFVVWATAYSCLSNSMGENSPGSPMLYSTVIFLIALAIGGTLAKHGIGFDQGSMKHRLAGIGLMLGGILSGGVGVGVTMVLDASAGAGVAVLGGIGLGLIIFFLGLLQFLTGRDLKSSSTLTRDL
jgi:hypothetical protein